MIQAYVGDLLLVGVTRKNIEKITLQMPLVIDLHRPVNHIVVVFGETKPDIITYCEQHGWPAFEESHKKAALEDPE